jgi:regulator of sirC expression with transglutaminase-like and TPR domain
MERLRRVGGEDEFFVALLVSEIVDPDRDRAEFELGFAELVDAWNAVRVQTPESLLEEFLGLGFGSDPVQQTDLCHSDIAWVFAEKKGIPIALAVLLIEAARRCGLEAQGVNFPGHFLVKLDNALVDPLAMRVLHPDEIKTANQDLERLLTPATPIMVGLRMLNNIKALHIANGRLDEALQTIDFQMALDPENRESVSSLHYERGELWQQLGAHSAAKAAYLSCAEISPFPRLAEQAKARAAQLGDGDEVWH